jgi:short-subunit dehydrogenase
MSKLSFSHSWVLITGASSGLGAEFAKQLGHRGANLILSARSVDKLGRLASDLAKVNGIETRVVVADLATPEGVDQLTADVDRLGVPLLHVINNAGFGSTGAFVTSNAETERRMLRLNAEAIVAVTRHFLPRLIARAEGGFIQVASTAGFQPTPFMATYGATKAFVLSFTLALAEELRGTGVRALGLCPGPVPTGFQQAAGIPASGLLKLSRLEAPEVVDTALGAYEDGRTLVVPGALNSVQTTAVKFLPRALVSRAARLAMRGLGRS